MSIYEVKSLCPSTCTDPRHKPPPLLNLAPGKYDWLCPACGERTAFEVVSATGFKIGGEK